MHGLHRRCLSYAQQVVALLIPGHGCAHWVHWLLSHRSIVRRRGLARLLVA